MKEEIVNKIYAAYGSDSGILFGITDRNVVMAIVEFTLNRLPKNEQPEQNEWSDEQWINFVMWYSGMNMDSVMQGIRQYKENGNP